METLIDINITIGSAESSDAILIYIAELIPQMRQWNKYHATSFLEKVDNFPLSGGGGAHGALLGLANHAIEIHLPEDAFVAVMLPRIKGTRPVYEAEIRDAYRKAQMDHLEGGGQGEGQPAKRGSRSSATTVTPERQIELRELRDQLISDGKGVTEDDIMMKSPVMIPAGSVAQAGTMFRELYYGTGSLLFAGSLYDRGTFKKSLTGDIRHRKHFERLGYVDAEYFIPNPLDGKLQPPKSGTKPTLRADLNVKQFRVAVAEHDNITLSDQLAFWSQIELPIMALIYSGGKSIHAWLGLSNITSLAEWNLKVKQQVYADYLVPMGVDKACSNPARMSRMPGFVRDTGKIQQLIYLNPAGHEGPIL